MTIKFVTEQNPVSAVVGSVEVGHDGFLLFKVNGIPVVFINPEKGGD